MAGFDDPRYLQQVITDLQQKVKKLEAASIPFLAHQRGAIPGAMRAVQVGDPNQKSAMWVNLMGNLPGQAPYQAITDAAGVVRAELGNLAANGISPAQFGFRANNAAGTPIFDSLGLIAVMSELGHKNSATPSTYTTTTPTLVQAGGTTASITFTLARQARVLALYSILGFSATLVGLVDTFVDGVNKSSAGWPDVGFGANTPLTTGVSYYSEALAVGSHTIELRGYLQGTPPGTLTVSTFDLIVWLLGA